MRQFAFDYTPGDPLFDHIANEIQLRANRIARRHRCNRATEIVFGNEDKVVSYTRFGYRKYTTGEYVSAKYRTRFGWKNTYYQEAKCVVMLNMEVPKLRKE